MGEYEPGSTIKPLVALALLRDGVSPYEKINCPGYSCIGNARIRCARRSGHGYIDMISALEHSCNVYFIERGRVLGLEKLARTFSFFGFGQKTGFQNYELAGLFPSNAHLYYKPGRN